MPAPRLRPAVDSRRTAVISGGTRGLGLELAKHAAAAGQKALVLMSRTPAMTPAQLAELAQRDTAVFVVACDAGDVSAAAAVRRWVRERLPAVQTYAHAAGALGHDLIPNVTPQAFLDVTRAKVHRKSDLGGVACPYVIQSPTSHARSITECRSQPRLLDWLGLCSAQVLCSMAHSHLHTLCSSESIRELSESHNATGSLKLYSSQQGACQLRCFTPYV